MKVNEVQNILLYNSSVFDKHNKNNTKKVEKNDILSVKATKIDVIKKKIEDGYYFTDEFNNLLADKLMKTVFNSEMKDE